MSNFVNGEVRISEPASLVSIALGGVFGESGGKPVSKVRLDKAGIKKYQRTEEGKCLKPFLMATSSIELELRESLRRESVLRYKLGKLTWTNPLFVIIMVECLICVFLGIGIGILIEMPLMTLLMLIIGGLLGLYGVIVQLILRKNIEKNFHKHFLSRLDRYIDIVRLKQIEDGTYQDESEED